MKSKARRMYAVSCDDVGLIGGTLGYNRKEAISHFLGGGVLPGEWEKHKRQGYRTVCALVEVEHPRLGRYRTTKKRR